MIKRGSNGRFIKGHNGYKPWLGVSMSLELREKLSNSHKGFKHTDEQKEKIRLKMLGRKSPMKGRKQPHSFFEKFNKSRNVFDTAEYREKISKTLRAHYGNKPRVKRSLNSMKYKIWRMKVFKRDAFTCQWCFKRGVRLEAHHIKPWASYPKSRFVIKNGLTLCVPCHNKTKGRNSGSN